MTKPICRSCGAETTDAFLCAECTNKLEIAIAQLPSAIHDLEVVIARQARIEATPTNRPAEDVPYGPAGRKLPAFLRSTQGEITLPETATMASTAASHLHALAENAVGTWVRLILENRGMDLPYNGPAGPWHETCRHGSCIEIRRERNWPTPRLCIWLLRNIDAVRMDEAAGEINAKVRALSNQIAGLVDRHDPDIYAGPCDAADIRVEHQRLAGPPCSTITCQHESCEYIRRGEGRIATQLATCGADLYARFGDTEVTCEVCGLVYELAERKKYLADQVDDEWARPQVIANALTTLAEPIKPATLRKWIERDRKLAESVNSRPAPYPLVLQRGIDDDGAAVYRVGDVRARISAMQAEPRAGNPGRMNATRPRCLQDPKKSVTLDCSTTRVSSPGSSISSPGLRASQGR